MIKGASLPHGTTFEVKAAPGLRTLELRRPRSGCLLVCLGITLLPVGMALSPLHCAQEGLMPNSSFSGTALLAVSSASNLEKSHRSSALACVLLTDHLRWKIHRLIPVYLYFSLLVG
ncbi:hypothetical protein BDW74DRAFT_78956 [Aspergillus multicolor]|uniref:uncharacterized protein n=1 Tax=Aspergillus multicolor TaxID=41759 RepID=UPI003CCD5E13